MKTGGRPTTVYFDPELHRALRIKAIERDCSVSKLVNESIRRSLSEDAEDLAAFEEREGERLLDFEQVVRELKANGKL